MEGQHPDGFKANGNLIPADSDPTVFIIDKVRKSTEIVLRSITEQANDVSTFLQSLKDEIENNTISTNEGMSFLEMKNHLLLHYLVSLAGIVKLKVSGSSIQNSVYLNKLVEIRTYLEKIKPIESKLKYQIDKLVTGAAGGASSADPLKFRANLDDLQNEVDNSENSEVDEEEVEKDKVWKNRGIYVPPKVAPQHFADDEEQAPTQKADSRRKRSINQSLIRELQEEFLDTPVEIHNMGDAYEKQLRKEVKEKQHYEETYMTRLPITKQDKHRARAVSTIGVLGDEITEFRKKVSSTTSKGNKKRKFTGKHKSTGKKFKRH